MPLIECEDHLNGRYKVSTELCPEGQNLVLDYFQAIIDQAGTADNNDSVDVLNAILKLITTNAPSPAMLATATAVVSNGAATSWVSVDCSLIVPEGTKAVMLACSTNMGVDTITPDLHLRQDSTNAAEIRLKTDFQQSTSNHDVYWFAMVGLDTDRTFDYKITQNQTVAAVTLKVVGYL